MTFDASPYSDSAPAFDLARCTDVKVCDLGGAERFLVWAIRWAGSVHEDPAFAAACLQDSFDRAALNTALPAFNRYTAALRGRHSACSALSRLGCWRLSPLEAATLHALACLQQRQFGAAWRTLTALCAPLDTARAMLALGELAELLTAAGVRIRAWQETSAATASR